MVTFGVKTGPRSTIRLMEFATMLAMNQGWRFQ